MENFINSVTRLCAILHTLAILLSTFPSCFGATTPLELSLGFKATPDSSVDTFQPLLSDPNGNFSLGFLRLNKTQLALAVLHMPSSEPFWLANPAHSARWSDNTHLTFNGSLLLSNTNTKLLIWSTHTTTTTTSDKVILLNNSNLQILNHNNTPAWQSFDSPTDTLVEGQNFTSNMTLVSSNGLYSMKLGSDFIGLYTDGGSQMYLRHKAMEAKTEIVETGPPIYAQINPDRYIGMYQTGNPLPADVQKFNSFQTPITGFLRLRLEPDGNLVGYFWDGSNWVLDYEAISDDCELPSACGSYGLCTAGVGCSCLDNRTEYTSASECFEAESGDFCGEGIPRNSFWILRRSGVELPYKELMRYEATSTMEQCEELCESNCSCWGAVFNNQSGFCYVMDHPIETLVGVGVGMGDETKMGYFKVREGAGRKKMNVGVGVGIGVICGLVLIFVGIIGVWWFRVCKRKRRSSGGGGGAVKSRFMEQKGGVSPGPYKDLASASFRSIEMGST